MMETGRQFERILEKDIVEVTSAIICCVSSL